MAHSQGENPKSPTPIPPKRPKRFQCLLCQRYFARLEHLQRHERTHTQEKPFSCDQCARRFTRRYSACKLYLRAFEHRPTDHHSDLLVRHRRLSHSTSAKVVASSQEIGSHGVHDQQRAEHQQLGLTPLNSISSPQNAASDAPHPFSPSTVHNGTLPLQTLSMAAEHAAASKTIEASMHDNCGNIVATPSNAEIPFQSTNTMMTCEHGFDEMFDTVADFFDNGTLSSQIFPSSFICAEQPIPSFSPETSLSWPGSGQQTSRQYLQAAGSASPQEYGSLSRFGSRLPSLQLDETLNQYSQSYKKDLQKPLSDISTEDRNLISRKLSEFAHVIPASFKLPSRLVLSRYIAGYINGFHEHMPCLHVQTMSVSTCSIELILAMAAVGAQYCFEGEKGAELFNISLEIALCRVKKCDFSFPEEGGNTDRTTPRFVPDHLLQINGQPSPEQSSWSSGPLKMSADQHKGEDLVQTAQALFLLMAMATWAKNREMFRQALSIQTTLATLIREDGLVMAPLDDGNEITWEAWIRYESVKRTKFIIFCFFNLQCIVYNIPPSILSSELDLPLPCSADEFKACSPVEWRETRNKNNKLPEMNFRDALNRLFRKPEIKEMKWYSPISSLGSYILIQAIIQYIFFMRQVPRLGNLSLSTDYKNQDNGLDELAAVEQALKNWQSGRRQNPESSLDPLDPSEPIAFNSTALLRLAYIRLNNMFAGTGNHALATRDPVQIALSLRHSPASSIRRTRKCVRAVLHSAHALSIPVKIGIRLVARTQTFIWSIQHSLCSLECAVLLCKWLEALASANPQTEVSEDEKRICWLVKTMLDETEYGVRCDRETLQSSAVLRRMSAGVLRVWAQIFKGTQTWAIVDIIGTALDIYADMLTVE